MLWIIDIVLLIILALCAWRGYRSGLIAGVLAVLAVLFSVYAADILAETYSGEFTKMLEPFVSGIVDSSSMAVEDAFEAQGREPGVYETSVETLMRVGLIRSAAEGIAEELSAEVGGIGQELRSAMVVKLCAVAAYVLTFAVMFLLLIIIFAVIGNLFNLSFNLPGLELINSVLGTVLGLIKGLIYVYAIAWLLRFTGLLLPQEKAEKLLLLRGLMRSCPLTRFLGV